MNERRAHAPEDHPFAESFVQLWKFLDKFHDISLLSINIKLRLLYKLMMLIVLCYC
jgi:hypothetical protein